MISRDELQRRVSYHPDTGEFVWLSGQNKGNRAGSVRAHGYRAINFGKAGLWYEHRLAHIYMTGNAPIQVDHINHNRADNRWENLRASNHKANTRNQKLRATNTSGVNGVCPSNCRGKAWRAYLVLDGKQKNLGMFNSLDKAKQVVEREKIAMGFHENHGRPLYEAGH